MATRLHDREPDERALEGALHRALLSGGAEDATGHLRRLAREAEEQARDRGDRLRFRHFRHRAELLRRAGGVLTAGEVAKRLGLHPVTVLRRARERQLLAIREGRRWFFPACQFGDAGTVPHLAELLAALPADADPWWVLDVLLAPSSTLGGLSPLEAARRGEPHLSRARDELRGYGADGFA